MNLSKQIDKDHPHHAYLLEGEQEQILPNLVSFLEEMGISCVGNPNVCQEFFDLFTIEQSRMLKERQIERGEGKKIFIISAKFFTLEAQNALLKVFEEPAEDVHFFIITPKADVLLDTLKSRLVILRTDLNDFQNSELGKDFLNMNKAERIKKVAKIIKDHESEENHSSLKTEAINLLNGIELALHEKTKNKTMTQDQINIFEELRKCRSYITDRGSSTKMLLEHIALLLPE